MLRIVKCCSPDSFRQD